MLHNADPERFAHKPALSDQFEQGFDEKVLALNARRMTTRDIQGQLSEL